jgi:hypothetical protein
MADPCRVGPAETVVQQVAMSWVQEPEYLSGLEDRTSPSGSSAGISPLYGEEERMPTSSERCVGFDVLEDRLDVAVPHAVLGRL